MLPFNNSFYRPAFQAEISLSVAPSVELSPPIEANVVEDNIGAVRELFIFCYYSNDKKPTPSGVEKGAKRCPRRSGDKKI